MLLRIRHITNYTYSAPVLLDPHSVRLIPRNCAGVKVLRHTLDVSPAPVGRSTCIDAEGNACHFLWFGSYAKRLTFTISSEIETTHFNPLAFIFDPSSSANMPFAYPEFDRPALAACLARDERAPAVEAIAAAVLRDTGGNTLSFLIALTALVNERCGLLYRPTGAPHSPAHTLALAQGSCRDLAVLYIDACRSAGLAARFVSGYILEGANDERRELHAWAEVYLPGAGWRGFDPSRGMVVGHGYVPVASAANPANAAPVIGAFRAANVTAALSARIEIENADVHAASP